MIKAELRTRFLAERRALSAGEVERRSDRITDQFFAASSVSERLDWAAGPSPTGKIVHTFLPIAHRNEVNTWPTVRRLWQAYARVQLAVPVVDMRTNQLVHYALTPETNLIKNRWGIPEPPPTADRLQPTDIDLVLVPLLAFDQHGHRVGYGGGYYDRFLAECRPDCQKIGLSLFDPVDRIADVEPTDVRLDVYITPTRVWVFNNDFRP